MYFSKVAFLLSFCKNLNGFEREELTQLGLAETRAQELLEADYPVLVGVHFDKGIFGNEFFGMNVRVLKSLGHCHFHYKYRTRKVKYCQN